LWKIVTEAMGRMVVVACHHLAVPLPLRPSHVVPTFSWSSTGGRWSLRPVTVAVLWAGLWIYGIGEALVIDARLGNAPWTVLAQGLSKRTGLTIGQMTILIGAAVLCLWWPLGERPGFGTVCNIILIGISIDVMDRIVPHPDALPTRGLQVVAGILVGGLGIALYLSAHLGPGPRDGVMTALQARTGHPITWVRLGLESAALVAGIVLGGRFGGATVLFALTIGHVFGMWLAVLHHFDRRSVAVA
jgi:uncharacterized membrane protein YczE